jgi:hypothetical protein
MNRAWLNDPPRRSDHRGREEERGQAWALSIAFLNAQFFLVDQGQQINISILAPGGFIYLSQQQQQRWVPVW